MPINDNDAPGQELAHPLPDAHGQAALLLVESLIHRLRERSLLTIDDAIDIVETALDVQTDLAEAADDAGAQMWRSQALLLTIAESLRTDGEASPTEQP